MGALQQQVQLDRESLACCLLYLLTCTELDYKKDPRLREIAPRGQREPGGRIHKTQGPP